MADYRGTFSGRTTFDLLLTVTESNLDAVANTSRANWVLYIDPTASTTSYRLSNDSAWSASINGVAYSGNFSYDFRTNTTSSRTLAAGYVDVTHTSNGSKTISVSAAADGLTPLGTASASGTLVLTDFVLVPGKPAVPTVTRTNTGDSITVTSAIPSSSVAITAYNYRYSTDQTNWTTASMVLATRQATLATAVTTSGYYLQTRATSSEGDGAWSDSAFIAGVPAVPATIALERSARNVTVTVGTSPTDGGAPITAYTVEYDSGSGYGNAQTVTGGSYTYTNLVAGLTYTFRAYATNSTGNSAARVSSALFVPAGGKRWDGSAWNSTTTAKRWDGSAWVDLSTAKRWDGSAWVDLS